MNSFHQMLYQKSLDLNLVFKSAEEEQASYEIEWKNYIKDYLKVNSTTLKQEYVFKI